MGNHLMLQFCTLFLSGLLFIGMACTIQPSNAKSDSVKVCEILCNSNNCRNQAIFETCTEKCEGIANLEHCKKSTREKEPIKTRVCFPKNIARLAQEPLEKKTKVHVVHKHEKTTEQTTKKLGKLETSTTEEKKGVIPSLIPTKRSPVSTLPKTTEPESEIPIKKYQKFEGGTSSSRYPITQGSSNPSSPSSSGYGSGYGSGRTEESTKKKEKSEFEKKIEGKLEGALMGVFDSIVGGISGDDADKASSSKSNSKNRSRRSSQESTISNDDD